MARLRNAYRKTESFFGSHFWSAASGAAWMLTLVEIHAGHPLKAAMAAVVFAGCTLFAALQDWRGRA